MEEWLYDWGGLNVALFHAINAKHAGWLDRLMLALTWAGDHDRFPLYLAVLALVTWWRFSRDPESPSARAWMLALATFSIGYLLDGMLVIGLKSAFDFPRPPAVLPADSLFIIGPPELRHSFPSGHASFAMLVAAVLWPEAKNLATRIALTLFVAGVCLSRPYLGMHFPADVLFGSLMSLLVVIAIRVTLTRWMPAWRG
jgi:membrane-associated phospholipid phosphatase